MATRSMQRMSLTGRQRQFAIIGCSRSAPKFSRSSVGTRERPLWPWPTFSAAWAKVKFRGRPVVRAENHDEQQWVDKRQLPSQTFLPKVGVDEADARAWSQTLRAVYG